jgi:hypothetical protein
MTDTLERQHEPEFVAPQNQPDHVEAAHGGEHLHDVEGLHYWSQDFGPIMGRAEVLANKVIHSDVYDEREQKWVGSVLDNRGELEKKAHIEQEHLMNDTRTIEHGGTIPGKSSVAESVESWYRRLGATNEAEDLTPYLVMAVDRLEQVSHKREHRLLAGNMLEDAAVRTRDDRQRFQLLDEAQTRFDQAVGERPDLTDEDTRESIRRSIDCEAMKQQLLLRNEKIDEGTFYKRFEDLQTKSIGYLKDTLKIDEHHMGDGELLEWASLIFLRHRRWSGETAEDFVIRDALMREDEAYYPWKLDYGANPGWSFDVVEKKLADNAVPLRLQLKVGKFSPNEERYRSYLPTEVLRVTSNIQGMQLQEMVDNGITAIGQTYKDMRHPNLGLKIDEKAIEEVDELFSPPR